MCLTLRFSSRTSLDTPFRENTYELGLVQIKDRQATTTNIEFHARLKYVIVSVMRTYMRACIVRIGRTFEALKGTVLMIYHISGVTVTPFLKRGLHEQSPVPGLIDLTHTWERQK